jgi:hypothetical protein
VANWPRRVKIAELERKIGQQALDIDFFLQSLARLGRGGSARLNRARVFHLHCIQMSAVGSGFTVRFAPSFRTALILALDLPMPAPSSVESLGPLRS